MLKNEQIRTAARRIHLSIPMNALDWRSQLYKTDQVDPRKRRNLMLSHLNHSGLENRDFDSLRTEDIRFSPSGKRLILAPKESLVLLELESKFTPNHIVRHAELRSPGLAFPHGVDFISESIIVVANRDRWITFFRLKPADNPEKWMEIELISEFRSKFFGPDRARRLSFGREIRCGPGSVRVNGDHLFITTNFENTITKHRFRIYDDRIDVSEGVLVACEGLEVLDGIAVSNDGRLIAAADTGHHRIVIYNGEDFSPTCELRDENLGAPHGICFDPHNRFLFASDAGGRELHVFESESGSWESSMEKSTFSCRGIGEAAFLKTKESVPEEFRALVGGIKGLDIDSTGRFIVGTCLNQFLCFFDTRANYFTNIDGPKKNKLENFC